MQDVEVAHEDILHLIYGSEADPLYQSMRALLSYQRTATLARLARGVSIDITRLLPFLYERFALQNLTAEAEGIVADKKLELLSRRRRTMSVAAIKPVVSTLLQQQQQQQLQQYVTPAGLDVTAGPASTSSYLSEVAASTAANETKARAAAAVIIKEASLGIRAAPSQPKRQAPKPPRANQYDTKRNMAELDLLARDLQLAVDGRLG